MDTNNNGQPTDDQELAQVLAGMNQQVGDQPATDSGLQFEETGAVAAADPAAPVDETTPAAESVDAPEIAVPDVAQPPEIPPFPETPVDETAPVIDVPAQEPAVDEPLSVAAPTATTSPELESIKKDALEQLRPLVDKLDLPAQEKFDTLLLIIRSTDDQSLLTAANEAAKGIEDETKRAEALLDVIKEIDFFSHPAQ